LILSGIYHVFLKELSYMENLVSVLRKNIHLVYLFVTFQAICYYNNLNWILYENKNLGVVSGQAHVSALKLGSDTKCSVLN